MRFHLGFSRIVVVAISMFLFSHFLNFYLYYGLLIVFSLSSFSSYCLCARYSKMRIKVAFEIGHSASPKSKKSPEGFTHDWELYVRGSEGNNISRFVDRVVFNLHESFPKPIRGKIAHESHSEYDLIFISSLIYLLIFQCTKIHHMC